MDIPIDIQELRTNLGYNCEVERKLLAQFVEFTGAGLDALRLDPSGMQNEAYNALWKNTLARIKEEAESIGASSIAEFAARAELQFAAAATVKLHLLDLVSREFNKVEAFILTVVGEDTLRRDS